MSNRLIWKGLEELKAELRNLPVELTHEAGDIVRDSAESAGDSIRAQYGSHVVTGNLVAHVSVVQKDAGQFGAAYQVKSTAKHASIFEKGTEARHYVTVRGIRKLVGKMPAFNIFIPTVTRKRRAMYERLRELLTGHGLKVTGAP